MKITANHEGSFLDRFVRALRNQRVTLNESVRISISNLRLVYLNQTGTEVNFGLCFESASVVVLERGQRGKEIPDPIRNTSGEPWNIKINVSETLLNKLQRENNGNSWNDVRITVTTHTIYILPGALDVVRAVEDQLAVA